MRVISYDWLILALLAYKKKKKKSLALYYLKGASLPTLFYIGKSFKHVANKLNAFSE